MSFTKKNFDEKLQELRHKDHSKVKYKKRLQEQEEADNYLKQELQRLKDNTFDRREI